LKAIFDVEEDPNYNPPPEDRPGGFHWGAAANEGVNANNGNDAPNANNEEQDDQAPNANGH